MLRRLKKEFSSKPSLHDADSNGNTHAHADVPSPESPTWCSPKAPKPIKTYGRKRRFRLSLQDATNTVFDLVEGDDSDLNALLSVHAEPLPPRRVNVVAANSKEKRRANRKETKWNSMLRMRLQGPEANAHATAARERDELLAKRRAEDEAIDEDERAEREFEAERKRLYADLRQAKEEGWVELRTTRRRAGKLGVSTEEGCMRTKRRRRNFKAIEEVIRQLEEDRERVWWNFYRSVEGPSLLEKQEMREIKRAKLSKPDYNSPAWNFPIRQRVMETASCLYCQVDDCEGC